MTHSKIILCIPAIAMLCACSTDGSGIMNGGSLNKSDIGTAAGVIGGGVIGSTIGSGAGQVAATIGGALLGGMLGNNIGHSLDNADRAAYDNASQNALETGKSKSWKNSHTGHRGTIHPHKSYTNDSGEYCREYTQSIYVSGKRHEGHGTACRQDDGTWQIVD
jgi:surface antigen